MTAKLYTKYQELDKIISTSNTFNETPILTDWSIKRDWNKAGSLTFKSPIKLSPGTHVKLVSPHHRTFGGQIIKRNHETGDFYSYDCLDYKRFLLNTATISHNNQTTSNIVKLLFIKYLKKGNGIFKLKLGKTKTIFPSLTFQDKTLLEIISNLINLEYKKGTLIFFDVDENGNLIYKPYPQKMKGYSLKSAIKFTDTLDYSDIVTGGTLMDADYNTIKSFDNDNLKAIWGNIELSKILSDNSKPSDDGDKEDSDIKKIIDDINKNLRNTSYSSCDCFCMSDNIFNRLKSNKIPCKIISYYSKYASSGTHRTVQYKNSKGWKDFDYTGFTRLLKPMSTRKNLKTYKIYKG
ncbi:hypothetical protein [Methanobrevibacter arboriphilus]|uniref:XkdQ/YqbQ family protein n=1 Tax=Methanobrevibacter arboriphilus TaxID=39441 RepID=UPI0005B29749|nr:hypothetical protein [Methanobrevibacter arboriphilus]